MTSNVDIDLGESQAIMQKLGKRAGWTTIRRARLAIAKEAMVLGTIDIIKEMKSIPTDGKLNVYVEESRQDFENHYYYYLWLKSACQCFVSLFA
ncbi:MAG: hypothetical protein WCC17_13630 [Candidatus Nitrosopolaris sp.]